jgi:ATP-dependent 26S proteasome regulatory subunit
MATKKRISYDVYTGVTTTKILDENKKWRTVKVESKEEAEEKLKEEMESRVNYTRWLKRGNNTFLPTDNSQIVSMLEAGVYDLRVDSSIGHYLFKKDIVLDELLLFPDGIHKEIIDSVKSFWGMRKKFKEYDFAFKRGVLIHGSPGNGKTSLINLCAMHLVEQLGGVVFHLKNEYELEYYLKICPEMFRIIEPDRPLIVIIEDIENFCNSIHETTLLNVLDGIDQMENVVYLATTNYIEKLKERIINRPSRFDRRIFVPPLSDIQRKYYFEKKLKKKDLTKIDLDRWVADTEGMSIAHLAELIKTCVIFGNDYEYSIGILLDMQNTKNLHSSKYNSMPGNLGFRAERVTGNSAKS